MKRRGWTIVATLLLAMTALCAVLSVTTFYREPVVAVWPVQGQAAGVIMRRGAVLFAWVQEAGPTDRQRVLVELRPARSGSIFPDSFIGFSWASTAKDHVIGVRLWLMGGLTTL